MKYLVDAQGYNQVRGLPFKATELADQIRELLSTIDLSTSHALSLVPKADGPQSAKEFKSDQEVRGARMRDYAILAAVQSFLP